MSSQNSIRTHVFTLSMVLMVAVLSTCLSAPETRPKPATDAPNVTATVKPPITIRISENMSTCEISENMSRRQSSFLSSIAAAISHRFSPSARRDLSRPLPSPIRAPQDAFYSSTPAPSQTKSPNVVVTIVVPCAASVVVLAVVLVLLGSRDCAKQRKHDNDSPSVNEGAPELDLGNDASTPRSIL
jgi:hypothetical protein